MSFEHKALLAFYGAIAVVGILGGWVLAIICFIGWLTPYALFILIRSVALYGNNNWKATRPSEIVTPKEMHRQ